jgi:hypothetical protein
VPVTHGRPVPVFFILHVYRENCKPNVGINRHLLFLRQVWLALALRVRERHDALHTFDEQAAEAVTCRGIGLSALLERTMQNEKCKMKIANCNLQIGRM